MHYKELTLQLSELDPWLDIAMAQLAELQFDMFENTDTGMKAYVLVANYDAEAVTDYLVQLESMVDCDWSIQDAENRNWNAEWEENFHPIEVEDLCVIRAPFHAPLAGKMNLVIMPKMSFGTGHHATTYLMTKALFAMPLNGQKVLDMGCGTSILAIAAEKLGATDLEAVDIDEWCTENSQENIELNQCQHIQVGLGDIDAVQGQGFGVILANINLNILRVHFEHYARLLQVGGILLTSGYYEADLRVLISLGKEHGLQYVRHEVKDAWCIGIFRRSGS